MHLVDSYASPGPSNSILGILPVHVTPGFKISTDLVVLEKFNYDFKTKYVTLFQFMFSTLHHFFPFPRHLLPLSLSLSLVNPLSHPTLTATIKVLTFL